MLDAQKARLTLKRAGLKLTPQRLLVIDVLVGNRTHPTVEQICERVRREYPSVSLATIYQTVSLLARHGLVLELHGGKVVRCDPDTSRHAHALCRHCGDVWDLPLTGDITWNHDTLAGFQPVAVEITLHGDCPRCARKQDQNES